MTEEEHFVRLMRYFALNTDYREDEIEDIVHDILDNPNDYPQYFY